MSTPTIRRLEDERARLLHDLAECYRLTGSDPDGDSDAHLARHAVQAVKELREENDRQGHWEDEYLSVKAQLEQLLGATEAHEANREQHPKEPSKRNQALWAAAQKLRAERGGSE